MNRAAGPPPGKNFTKQKGFTAGPNKEGGVPGTIKCQVCNKMKSKDQYSNRQLQKFSSYSKGYTRNPDSTKITCSSCTATQIVELNCYICSQTKGLEAFAKAQRKDPDNARCIKCVNKVLDTEPDMDPPDSDGDDSEDAESDEDVWDNSPGNKASVGGRYPKGKRGESGYPESSASSRNGSSFSTTSRSQAGHSGQYRNTLSDTYANSPSGGNVWENVEKAGTPLMRNSGAPAIYEATSHNTAPAPPQEQSGTKATGWAKVTKVHKGKEKKWLHEDADDGVDEWDRYGREIRDQKSGKPPKSRS